MIESKLDENIFKNSRMPSAEKKNVCNFDYLNEAMGFKKDLVKGIMDVFLSQVPKDLHCINEAVTKPDYAQLKSCAHSMRSSVAVMGISVLTPVLLEMEELGRAEPAPDRKQTERLRELNTTFGLICRQAIQEIECELHNFG